MNDNKLGEKTEISTFFLSSLSEVKIYIYNFFLIRRLKMCNCSNKNFYKRERVMKKLALFFNIWYNFYLSNGKQTVLCCRLEMRLKHVGNRSLSVLSCFSLQQDLLFVNFWIYVNNISLNLDTRWRRILTSDTSVRSPSSENY